MERRAMPISTRRRALAGIAALPLATLAPRGARAGSLDSYRAQGVIAERYDGYVEIRAGNPPADAKRIVERVNEKRRQIYQKRADSEGVAPEAVGKVYAKQIWQDAPDGTYLKKPDGAYVQK
jgi:hypothetical protein